MPINTVFYGTVVEEMAASEIDVAEAQFLDWTTKTSALHHSLLPLITKAF